MSIPVEAKDILKTIEEFGTSPYIISNSENGHPHVANLEFQNRDGALIFNVGRRGSSNIDNSPQVTLLWPPKETGGYNLIIDGFASKHSDGDSFGQEWKISFNSGILHRPAGQNSISGDSDCGSDCQTL